jgi:hypothetical protein
MRKQVRQIMAQSLSLDGGQLAVWQAHPPRSKQWPSTSLSKRHYLMAMLQGQQPDLCDQNILMLMGMCLKMTSAQEGELEAMIHLNTLVLMLMGALDC